MKKPWEEHSSKWDVPWDQRPEQNFDTDKHGLRKKDGSILISISGIVALLVILPLMLGGITWAVKNPRFNENPHFNNCKLVKDESHPTGAYYRCHE